MRKLVCLMCGVMLAVAACAQAPAPDGEDAIEVADRSEISSALTGASTQTETCTTTESACKVGRCELGPNDRFITITEVCCTAPGVCTTERYKLCGC